MLCQIHGLRSWVGVGVVELLRIVLRLVNDSVSQNLIWSFLLKLVCELQVGHRLVIPCQLDGQVSGSSTFLVEILAHDQFFFDGILVSSHETFIILPGFELGRRRILVGRSRLNLILVAQLACLTLELKLLQMEQIVALSCIPTNIHRGGSALF